MDRSVATAPEPRPATVAPPQVRVMAVVVVYERPLERVEAWRMLLAALAACDAHGSSAMGLTHVLVYDNSAMPRAQPDVPIAGCSYVHDRRNGGTAAAYRAAAERATELGIGWLLLLDQDTQLPADFFRSATAAMQRSESVTAALLPWVFHGPVPVSPARVTLFGTVLPLKATSWRPSRRTQLTGIASGALVRVCAVRSLSRFPVELWLDYVDHWMWAQFQRQGLQIGTLDATLEHNLSVADPASLSRRRLTSILAGENLFVCQLGWLARLVHPVRLLVRASRLWCVQRAHARQVLVFLFLRR